MKIAIVVFGLFLILGFTPAVLAQGDGSISGLVVNPDDHPVSGATVKLTASDEQPRQTATDTTGHYRFNQVIFDTYTVTVEAPGYPPEANVVTVQSGNNLVVDFHLSVKTIGKVVTTGSSVSASGQPVSVNVISSQTVSALPNSNSLQRVVQTVPGIVPFSYNEPVARGFHGITYVIDDIPLPQTAGQYFSEAIDPRSIDRLEIYTGAMPAEYGGQRQGAVVDILTKAPNEFTGPDYGTLSLTGGTGTYSSGVLSYDQSVGSGNFRGFFDANIQSNTRGLDPPTTTPEHDDFNQNDGFMRLLYAFTPRDTLAFDYSTQYAQFQIPIDTNQNDPNNPNWVVPGTDDNQNETQRFSNLTFNHQSKDGNGFFEVTPWWTEDRLVYLPDPANDLASAAQSSTYQNRYSNFLGLASGYFRSDGPNNLKFGGNIDVQNMTSQFNILFIDSSTGKLAPPFTDNVAQRGSNTGLYAQDEYNATPYLTINAGVRWDLSTGFVTGNQISPRLGVNLQATHNDVIHFYYGRLYAAPSLEDTRRAAVVIDTESEPNSVPVYDLKPERDSIYEAGEAHNFSPFVSGFVTLWARHVNNVLDTTQIGSTPLFTVFNSAGGQASGLELRLNGRVQNGDSWYLSYGESYSIAEGISGGTFAFPVDQLQGANGWALEDHDQTNTINTLYRFQLSPTNGRYASVQALYGSGFPVQFENGEGRLPVHWEINAAIGQPAAHNSFGWELAATNLLNHVYLIKVANGFNSTQYAAGRQVRLTLSAPLF